MKYSDAYYSSLIYITAVIVGEQGPVINIMQYYYDRHLGLQT